MNNPFTKLFRSPDEGPAPRYGVRPGSGALYDLADAERERLRQAGLASRLRAEEEYRDAAAASAQRDAQEAEAARRAASRRELPLHWRRQLEAAESGGDAARSNGSEGDG